MEALSLIVVDDESAHFQLIERAVTRYFPSASVIYFPNPMVCLERIDEIRPDVIITDYHMPGMDGLGFLEVLNRERKDIPVIIITGKGDENIAVKAMKLGAWDYLVKSADCFSTVPGVIEKVIRERKLRSSLLESERLNSLLLDALPHPAMLIGRDRKVLAANRIAQESGAVIGGYCWRDFADCRYLSAEQQDYLKAPTTSAPLSGFMCSFCLADEALTTSKPARTPELRAFGLIWDTWWVPIDGETFLHYAIDISDRKNAEERIRGLTRLLIKAQEDARRKLAYDLHDTISQDLSSLKIGIDTLLDDGPDDHRVIKERLDELSIKLEETIRSLRDMAYTLRPPTLDELGLVRTIYQYCEEFSASYGIPVDLVTAGMDGVKLGFDTGITLYRLIQEGLNNVWKHADASSVSIKLVASYPRVIVRIEDNGKGFDVQDGLMSALDKKCLGLRSMEERVALLDGQLWVESRPMQGTRIRIEIPLEE
jgi:signal transduction histidine kinase